MLKAALRLLALLLAGMVAARVLVWGTAGPLAAVRSGTATVDDLLVVAAAAGAWAILAWGAIVAVGTVLSVVPGIVGRAARRFTHLVTTAGTRRVARSALGLALAAGTATACSPGEGAVLASGPQVVAADELSAPGRPGELITSAAESDTALAAEQPAQPAQPAEPVEPVEPSGGPGDSDHGAVASSTSPDQDSKGRDDLTAGPLDAAGVISQPSREPAPDHVVVRRGDSLWAIAAAHLGPGASDAQIAAEWPRWYAANRDAIGDDPDLILPGMILQPPPDH